MAAQRVSWPVMGMVIGDDKCNDNDDDDDVDDYYDIVLMYFIVFIEIHAGNRS